MDFWLSRGHRAANIISNFLPCTSRRDFFVDCTGTEPPSKHRETHQQKRENKKIKTTAIKKNVLRSHTFTGDYQGVVTYGSTAPEAVFTLLSLYFVRVVSFSSVFLSFHPPSPPLAPPQPKKSRLFYCPPPCLVLLHRRLPYVLPLRL